MLMVSLVFFSSCKPTPPPDGVDDDGNDGSLPTKEGIYLGVIGFNENFTTKDIKMLNESSINEFRNFINALEMKNGTGLYYADYLALNKLDAYGNPPKLNNVALVTFTDGLDNVSLNEETNPENHSSTEEYCNSLNDKIKNNLIHGKKINAYTIGIKGTDVYDELEFHNNLTKLASEDDNVFEVSDMNEALERFSQIAESLHSETTTTSLKLQIPGGYNDGVKIRLTFDNVSSAENSTKYIECTYRWSDGGRTLENVVYEGLQTGATVLYSVGKVGSYYVFEFKNLSYEDGSLVSSADINKLKLWRQISSGAWQPDTEFTPDNSTQVTEEQSSALIMLVLDCSISLGDQFPSLKQGAISFIETLFVSSSDKDKPTVKTTSASNDGTVKGNVTSDGGAAVTERGVCWSTSQNPTINGYHKASGSGTGSFSVDISGLTEGTTYYVRAYATNIIGTSYGEEKSFKYTTTFTVNGVTFKMIKVEGGTFSMGATSEQGSSYDSDEKPVHSVTLSDYYIGETEVTQELWQAVMGNNPSYFSGNNPQRPVENVSWNDCQDFIKKLNQLTGKTFRLPTEAEWEYAARGGKKSKGYKYSGSNNIGDVAWYDGNSSDRTYNVKTKLANELGIYDMSGNVYEWCQDWYGDYSSSSQTNPAGPSSGSYRVLRGGGWYSNAARCRVSFRYYDSPGGRSRNLGLRVVCLP